ncbi:YetF domain-containing protein [Klenkia sp. LSe6-5]|uniref:YetF domain-containing protein n=1 Tax=Klenkia sesuvii TaxID=3103137 RepID=A0ABU8DS31_9ACTN
MWFDTWSDLLRILLVGVSAYAALVLVLRVSGKRTLAKLNAFDLVVTVALGSTLATVLLSSDVSWSEGASALVLLVALQYVVARLTVRLPWARSVVTARPTPVLVDGDFRPDAMRAQRVAESEVRQAVRASGQGALTDVAAVVLESDGTLSVVPASAAGDRTALADVPDAGGQPTWDDRRDRPGA